VAPVASGAPGVTGVAVWPFNSLSRSHWILLVLVALFLFTYFGLLSWGRIEDSLEALAEHPRGAKVFQIKVDRADAILIVFMFLLLTPMALVAVFGAIAFVGAVVAGFLESLLRVIGLPAWLFAFAVYVLLAVGAYLMRAVWLPQAQGFMSLVARAILAAYQ
jgi:hypothetical protein